MFKLREFIKSLGEKSRLRQKLLRFFLFAGILPLILMGLAGVYLVNRIHRIDVSAIELNIARQKAVELEKFIIGDVVGLFRVRIDSPQVWHIETSRQEFLLEALLEENPAILEASFICTTPFDPEARYDPKNPPCKFGKETTKKSRFQVISEEELVDQIKNPKFTITRERAGKIGEDYYVSPVYYTLEGPMITVAAPVYNKNDRMVMILTGDVTLSAIQESASRVNLGESGYLYIVDNRSQIVAHSKNIAIGELASKIPLVLDVLVGKKRTGLARQDLYRSLWGERVIGAGQDIPSLHWAVIIEWPFVDAQKVVGTMLLAIAEFSLGTLLLIIALAAFLAWQLIRPITALKEGAKTIGEGQFDYRISLRTNDELEELGHSLNKMAESLKQLEELHELKLKTQYLAEALAKEQELSKLKDQFISVASHQLYTPLSVIGWTLETLRDPKTPRDALVQGWQTINQSRQDLLDIASDLLTISEIGFRYEKTKSEIISLEEVTKTAMAKYRDRLDEKKLSLEIKAAKDTKVDAASFTIEKVIENLLSNAITYSNEGGKILIEISSSKNEVAFKIKDEGIGIPKEEQSSVFQAFFRAKNAVEKKNVGTGLGLFIVKTVIDGHKGKISFESEQNKGTTFTFVLPRK